MTTIHALGLPHTATNKDYIACAFTQKVRKFCAMFKDDSNYRVIHYGHEKSETAAAEQVDISDDDLLRATYMGHDWKKNQFRHDRNDLAHKVFNSNAAKEIYARKKKGDLVLAFWSGVQDGVEKANKDNDLIVIEPGIGSAWAFAKFRCFESYAVKGAYAGTDGIAVCRPEWYWRVVPNYFDLEEFDNTQPREEFALYIGRIGRNKGLDRAIDACKRMGVNLKVCGQGNSTDIGFDSWPSHVEFLGYADVELRKELMSKAKFGFLLSTYWEPFGGTAVEMMLSGCVPITSDFGAMTEYIVDGLNGFRCNTMADILRSIRLVQTIDRQKMIRFAEDNFSYAGVKPKFHRAFDDFKDVHHGAGWYEEHDRPLISMGLNYRSLYV